MANSNQLKALFKAFADGDNAQLTSIGMQIAANEASAGHGKLAQELRALIDASKVRLPQAGVSPIPMAKPRGEVADLLTVSYPNDRLANMVLTQTVRSTLERVLREHKNVHDIRAMGLAPRKKLLLLGPPGTARPSPQRPWPENSGCRSLSSGSTASSRATWG